MNNWTLKAKIMSLLTVSLVALALVGLVGWRGLGNTADSLIEVGKNRLPSVLGLEIINEAQTAVRSSARRIAQYENNYKAQDKFAKIQKENEEVWGRVEQGWKMYEPLPQTAEESIVWALFVKEWDAWKATDEEIAKILDALANNMDEKKQVELFAKYYQLMDSSISIFDKSAGTLDKIIALNIKYGNDAVAAGDKEVSSSKTVMLASFFGLLVILLLFGLWVVRNIMQQLGGDPKLVAEVANKIAVGDLSSKIELDVNDKTSVMAAMKGMSDSITTLAMSAKTISEGDLSVKVAARSENDVLSKSLIQVIGALNGLVADANVLTVAAIEGRLSTRADATKHQGDFRKIVEGVNATLDAVINPLNVAANYVERISMGDTPPKITDTYNGDFNAIKNNLNQAIDAINQQAATAQSIAKGDLSITVNVRSENDVVAKSLELVRDNLKAVIADTDSLIKAATEGRLDVRADASKHQGDYHKIVEGLNATLDAVVVPINEVAKVLTEIEHGNLTQTVKGHYKGQLEDFKDTVNNTIAKISQVITEVNSAASNIASASEEVSATAQSMSQATSEQAASVEQTSSAVEEMSASISQNTENAKVTDGMATQASGDAVQGGDAVKKTVSAMKSIAGKIGIIDDIAYQTNLLALNAAIEAARAGEHGKGFAVVAAEVRNLAERSQVAAQEIGELASSSVEMAENAGKLLDTIVPSIKKTADLVQEITAASEEQSTGVAQINTAMNQLNQITQQNASASEELAATSEEMSGQAMQLQELMEFFTVTSNVSASATNKHPSLKLPVKKATPDHHAFNEDEFVRF